MSSGAQQNVGKRSGTLVSCVFLPKHVPDRSIYRSIGVVEEGLVMGVYAVHGAPGLRTAEYIEDLVESKGIDSRLIIA